MTQNGDSLSNIRKDLKALTSLFSEYMQKTGEKETNERYNNFETSHKQQTKTPKTDLEVFTEFLDSVKCEFESVNVLGKKMISIKGKFTDNPVDYTATLKKFHIDTLRIGNGMRFGGLSFYYGKDTVSDLVSWIKTVVIKQ